MTADEHEYDVVVAGSGAAGMTAALAAAHRGLRVVVVEKAARFGGSTARSGGGLWIPGNEVLARAGVTDDPAATRAYLAHVVGPHRADPASAVGLHRADPASAVGPHRADPASAADDGVTEARQRALLDHGPAMLAFVRAHTPLEFRWVPGYPDYYPEAPGGLPQGRTIEPVPLDGRVLGAELARLNPPYLPAPVPVTATDYRWLSLGTRHPRAYLTTARLAARATVARLRGQRLLSMGQALAAGLRAGLLDAGVPVRLDTPMTGLELDGGRVTGVRVGDGALLRARRGVLVTTGGFEHDASMRERYQRAPIGTAWTVGAATNTGDGIRAGEQAGAALALMDDAWWGPSIPLPRGPYFCLAERSLPGSLLVDQAGTRFVNESAPYVDAVRAMYDHDAVPAWLITDQRYRNRYLFAGLGPRRPVPRRWYASEAAYRAATVAELAELIAVPPDALEKTLARFNDFARTGRDDDFHRGDSAYDRYYGDPRTRPNPCLAPLDQPPYYAFRMVPGDLGTKGGLVTDERGRVLRADGSAIPGLYAAGNASAAVMGRSYAGAGATIGPAMTFGYLAALDLAGSAATGGTVRED